MTIRLPRPGLQVDFALVLLRSRELFLHEALSATIRTLDIALVDQQLSSFVPKICLSALAGRGLRAELMFPVPLLLNANPYLLGYYRLLYGYSQKAFYTSETGIGPFSSMEKSGRITATLAAQLPPLCQVLCSAAADLLDGIGSASISAGLLDDLTILTLGPQLRGGANVKKGAAGIVHVFDAISHIVAGNAIVTTANRIEVMNAAARKVLIQFSADPDIVIREVMVVGGIRNIIAIEVKGGSDFSNIHNRIGEAEKSHRKARDKDGFVECWTVVNVDRIDIEMARRESPTTNRFYLISDLVRRQGPQYEDFRSRIISLTGITA